MTSAPEVNRGDTLFTSFRHDPAYAASNPRRRIQQPWPGWPATQAGRRAVSTPAGGAVDMAGSVVEQNAIHATSNLRNDLEVMAAHRQFVAHGGGDARFHFEGLALCPDAWGLDGFLQCHTVVDDVDDRLQHGCEDAGAARGAQGHERTATPEHDYR